ncbi:MAG: hypothetical protein EB036_13235, partial [Betaproteobacteria bacterium]|nr:hypothetical protein [Betaproteobacteria bacterium]
IPVFGLLNKKVAISRFCRTLGTLLSSGVPIMQALEIVGKASGNEIIAMTVTKIRDSIREGESIATPLGSSGMFPPMVTQMVAVGEETGNLDAMLSMNELVRELLKSLGLETVQTKWSDRELKPIDRETLKPNNSNEDCRACIAAP